MNKEIARHLEAIKENSVDLISEEELITKIKNSLNKKKPLKLKIGFDPTASDIHLGHTVLLRKLRRLQDLGHQVYFIIGDFTAKIGDPSQRTALRPILSDKEIKANAATYTNQAFKILDKSKTKVIYNSIWYKNMPLSKFLSLLSSYTLARILERDDFSQRLKEGRPLTLLEVTYPLIQGYDSYKLEADIEFGGTDQKFNLIVGRRLQQAFGQVSQAIVTMPILVGLDGKNKMSKSLDNYIGITDKPKEMFGKIMSISDEVMWEYFRLLTDYDVQGMKEIHPKQAKLKLAENIVSFYYSAEKAKKEKKEFEKVFSEGKLPQDILIHPSGPRASIITVLSSAKIVSSKNEARRLLSQGAISFVNPEDFSQTTAKQDEFNVSVQGEILKIGKKKFLKIVLKNS
ncbi:MAG: tyrosine--tRNA ligase [Omnitrophica bacterium]|nr:tyrosine--tRNA ligase [Candidatus Omnitrophota bacterium]